jgi:TatD DNase family protein
VVAIGETGLDYYRDWTSHEHQIAALRWHLDLAEARGLPVVIHNRNSDEDVTRELVDWAGRRSASGAPGVLHSFSGTQTMLRSCAEAGYGISFSGMITFANKSLDQLRALAAEAPPEAILVETDAPYLAPAPFRGRRNEPAYVRAVAERLAEVRSTSLEEISELTSRNTERVFPRLRWPANA